MRSMQWQLGVLGTISAFTYRNRETKKNLCRGGRSQDGPDTGFQPAVRLLKYERQQYTHKGQGKKRKKKSSSVPGYVTRQKGHTTFKINFFFFELWTPKIYLSFNFFFLSSQMALQSSADRRLRKTLLQGSSVSDFSLQFLILHLFISVCTQFHLLLFGLSFNIVIKFLPQSQNQPRHTQSTRQSCP